MIHPRAGGLLQLRTLSESHLSHHWIVSGSSAVAQSSEKYAGVNKLVGVPQGSCDAQSEIGLENIIWSPLYGEPGGDTDSPVQYGNLGENERRLNPKQ